jgi:hypothetical protein
MGRSLLHPFLDHGAESPYHMPIMDDGSEYRVPAVGIIISRRFRPNEWNALSDAEKWRVIEFAEHDVSAPAPNRGRVGSPGEDLANNRRRGDVLARIDLAVRKRRADTVGIHGLFGSSDAPFQPPGAGQAPLSRRRGR